MDIGSKRVVSDRAKRSSKPSSEIGWILLKVEFSTGRTFSFWETILKRNELLAGAAKSTLGKDLKAWS